MVQRVTVFIYSYWVFYKWFMPVARTGMALPRFFLRFLSFLKPFRSVVFAALRNVLSCN